MPSSEARLLIATGPCGPFTMGGVLHIPSGSVIGSNYNKRKYNNNN
jgi:hypothetical protein